MVEIISSNFTIVENCLSPFSLQVFYYTFHNSFSLCYPYSPFLPCPLYSCSYYLKFVVFNGNFFFLAIKTKFVLCDFMLKAPFYFFQHMINNQIEDIIKYFKHESIQDKLRDDYLQFLLEISPTIQDTRFRLSFNKICFF